ncbi:MAG: high-potential iron-sulfur protein [Gammaproteobacteria bacterium]|nr:high-potential iron-sulfur protein [Gammaproteobacteria bacterium]
MKILTRSRNPSGSMPFPDAHLTEADDPSRRTLLRGALAAGCSLLVPAALLGCDRGTQTDATGTTPDDATGTAPMTPAPESAEPTSPAPGTGSTAAPAAGKVSQASVQYQNQPKDGQSCANCIHFIAPNACKVVEGVVSPEGWCVIWVGQT